MFQYYPTEVAKFFCVHHSEAAISKDIENDYMSVLKVGGEIIATGCFLKKHTTKVLTLSEYQKRVVEHLL